MKHDSVLRLIRQKLVDGRLPRSSMPLGSWAAAGNGDVCVGCDLDITKDHRVVDGIGAGMKALRFHVECFSFWDAERKLAGR